MPQKNLTRSEIKQIFSHDPVAFMHQVVFGEQQDVCVSKESYYQAIIGFSPDQKQVLLACLQAFLDSFRELRQNPYLGQIVFVLGLLESEETLPLLLNILKDRYGVDTDSDYLACAVNILGWMSSPRAVNTLTKAIRYRSRHPLPGHLSEHSTEGKISPKGHHEFLRHAMEVLLSMDLPQARMVFKGFLDDHRLQGLAVSTLKPKLEWLISL